MGIVERKEGGKKREREREETAAFGRGLATKELLRLRSFSNAVVIYSYGSSCRAAKPHAHGSVASVSRRGGGWEKEREERKEQPGIRKLRKGLPQGNPHGRKERTHRVLAFERGRLAVCVRSVRWRCVDRARGA